PSCGSASKRTQPCQEFDVSEGFSKVIVRPEIEAGYAVVEGPCGSEHEDPHGVDLVTQNAADSVAVEYRKVAVEDHDVHIDLPGLRQGAGPVAGAVNEIAHAPPPHRERLGQVDLDVDNLSPQSPFASICRRRYHHTAPPAPTGATTRLGFC